MPDIKKMKNKKILLIISIILLLLGITFIAIGINKKQKEIKNPSLPDDTVISGEIYEPSGKPFEEKLEEPVTIEETKKYKGLEISSFKLEMISQRECEITAVVENKTQNEIEVQNIKLKLYDKDGNLQDTIGAQIDSMKPGEQKPLITLLRRQNIAEITKIEIEENN